MKYLILIADSDEFIPMKNSLGNKVTNERSINYMPAFDFSHNSHNCTAVCFGIGKVNAAMGTVMALTESRYDGAINTGWSGAVSKVFKGEIVVGESCVECDFDLTPVGLKQGQKSRLETEKDYVHTTDNALFNKISSIDGFKTGKLGTGDFFLTNKDLAEKYKSLFNINAFDMESGALAAACKRMNTPFISIRKISDNADDVSADTYKDALANDTTAFSDLILKCLEAL